jgi:hypothetical protein
MDGWAIARRIVLVVAICLVQPFLCAGVTWHLGLKSWQIDWQPSVNYHWQWRDQWSIPFTPYQANIMRSLIEEATADLPPFKYSRDMTKWPPIIKDMWARGELDPYQMLSAIMWYEDGASTGFGSPPPETLEELNEAAVQLSNMQTSPEWALIAGVECERHIWQDNADTKPSFRELSKGFYERARELDPDWDAPYIGLMNLYQGEVFKGVSGGITDLETYERNKGKLPQPPEVIQAESHRLMKLYMETTDYRSVARPPWAKRFDGRPTWGSPYSWPVSQWPPSSLVKLLTTMSIDERDADGFAFVLDFIASSCTHGIYYGANLRYYDDIYQTAHYRINDNEVMKSLRHVYEYSINTPHNDIPKGEYRKLYPTGEPTYEEVLKRLRIQDVTENVITPLHDAAVRMRELGPKAFAPKVMHDAIINTRRKAWDANEKLWPFSLEAAQLWEKLPPGEKLSSKSKLAETYLLGWQLTPNISVRSFYEQEWNKLAKSVYDDPAGGFRQRATVAYWTPYTHDESFVEEVLDDAAKDNGLVEDMPAEWAYAMWTLADKAYRRYRSNLKGYDERRNAYRPMVMKYITLAVDKAPDWAQAQETRLQVTFAQVLDEASIAAGFDAENTSFTKLETWMPYMTAEDKDAIILATQALISADDSRILIPPPWAVRMSMDELAQLAPNSNLVRLYKEKDAEYSYNTHLGTEKNLPLFLAEIGCDAKQPETAALAFGYLAHSYELNIDDAPYATSRAYDLKEALQAMLPYLADTAAKAGLTKLTEDLVHKCNLEDRIYHYKTTEFKLPADDLAAAKSAYARQEAELNAEILTTAQKMAEIVAGMSPSDFVEPVAAAK